MLPFFSTATNANIYTDNLTRISFNWTRHIIISDFMNYSPALDLPTSSKELELKHLETWNFDSLTQLENV